MKKIPKQEYTAEFRALAVKRVKEGLTPGAAAKELGVNHQTLRNWIKAAEAGKLGGAGKGCHTGADGAFQAACREHPAEAGV